MQGKTLAGRYYIKSQLGGGGFAITYLAEDRLNLTKPRRVVKQLMFPNTDPANLKIARRLFEAEAKVLEELKYDRIPKLLDYFEENGEFFLVQEFIDGHDLSQEITPGKKFTEDEVMAFLQDFLQTLSFVHQHNIIHRDLKPANLIRRASDKKIVLIDFGAVKEIGTQIQNPQGQIQRTVVIGTPGYTPPEQKFGEPNLSSDIYAVGAIAIQALTGVLPDSLPRDARDEIVWRDRCSVSDRLANILTKMVRYNYRDRYQSAAEVLQALFSSPGPPGLLSSSGKVFIGIAIAIFLAIVAVILAISDKFFDTTPSPSPSPSPPSTPSPTPSATPSVILSPTLPLTPPPILSETLAVAIPESFFTEASQPQEIQIKYPPSWNPRQILSPITKEVVEIFSPDYQASLLITVEPLERFMSLDEYSNVELQNIQLLVANPNNIQTQTDTLAKRPAFRVVYQIDEGGKIIKRMEVWTLKDKKAYVVTYQAEARQYSSFLPTIEKAIDSLEIVDN